MTPTQRALAQRLRTVYGAQLLQVSRSADGRISLHFAPCPDLDLDPLQGVPIASLNLSKASPCSWDALSHLDLEELFLSGCNVSSLAPLAGLSLKRLDLSWTQVADVRFLQNMPLAGLVMTGAPVQDLSPLGGVPLRVLAIRETRCRDLSFVQGLPLELIDFTPTRDLIGIEHLRHLPTLRLIGTHEPAEFWRLYDEGAIPGQHTPAKA